MSLILEALKKSEAERRLGRAPDLLTPIATPPAQRRPWLWLWGAVLGLASALLLVLGLWARSALTLSAPPASPPAVAPGTMPPPVASASQPPAPASRATALPQRTPAEAIANVPLPQDPDFAGTERESMPMPAGAIPLPPPGPAENPAPAPAPAPARMATSHPTAVPTPIPTPLPAPPHAAAPVGANAATQPAPPSAPVLEPLQHLATLPAAQREGLPPLRLSMHVYDPDPAARFVLIDGKRFRQGDAVADGVIVDAIRPDGVAIARGTQRFLLPRP